jgi:branched-chain amino acid transport system ATP-binding protein
VTTVPVLELCGVRAGYGRIQVLHGVDLAVPAGSVFALLGPNGAGKTTTLGVISGQIAASGGEVRLVGRNVRGAGVDALARAGVCTIPEGRGVFPNLTVGENVRMFTHRGVSRRHVEERTYEQFPRLHERRAILAGRLSGGEQQMLSLARGLATDPALLLLDELSMGLAPMIVEELYGVVAEIARSGVSIVVVEQFAGSVLAVADRAAIMTGGRVQVEGTPHEIERALSTAYLGASA